MTRWGGLRWWWRRGGGEERRKAKRGANWSRGKVLMRRSRRCLVAGWFLCPLTLALYRLAWGWEDGVRLAPYSAAVVARAMFIVRKVKPWLSKKRWAGVLKAQVVREISRMPRSAARDWA